MAFFDDLGKKLTQAGQGAVAKGKEIADVAKLNSQVSDEEKKMNNAYQEIGKKYVELHRSEADPEFAGLITSIDEADARIKELKGQIADIKGVVKCPKCGADVPKGAAFCGSCGGAISGADANAANPEPSSTAKCPSCGAQLKPGAAFCGECGMKLE